jgi:hypothetical protein
MDLGTELGADAGFARRIRQQGGVEEGDEGFRDALRRAVGAPGADRAEHSAGCDRCIRGGVRVLDAGTDVLDEPASELDTGGYTCVILDGRDGSLDDAAEVQRDAIGGLGGSKLGGPGLEALPQLAQARREGLRDEDFIEATVVPRHSHRIVFGFAESHWHLARRSAGG